MWWVSRVSLIIKLSVDLATYSQGHSDTPNSRSAHGQLGLHMSHMETRAAKLSTRETQ